MKFTQYNGLKWIGLALVPVLFVVGCSSISQTARSYRKTQDAESLKRFLTLIPEEIDTSFVRRHLGTPIDMGFDYRYLTEEISEEGCAMGAVFHIKPDGSIGDRWYGAICE